MVIEANINRNPISDCGNILTGDRFVGRAYEVETIRNRILVENGGNIAIMGLPRIGKSSLSWKALYEEKNNALKDDIYIIRINIGDIQTSDDFYKLLISNYFDELEYINRINEKLLTLVEKYKNKIYSEDIDQIDKKNAIWRFFKLLSRENISVIYLLDEFDHIGAFFKLEDFQLLRELSINPETKLSLATVSRRSIDEIELLGNISLSNLSNVFSDLYLGLFTDSEVDKYWDKLTEFGVKTDDEYRMKVKYFAGNHPFIIDRINFEVINYMQIYKSNNINKIINENIKLTILKQYDNMIHLLQEEELYEQMLHLLYGIGSLSNSKSIERLEKFGMIYKDRNEKYQAFSLYFKEYIKENIKEDISNEVNIIDKQIFLSYSSSTNEIADKLEQSFEKNIKDFILIRDQSELKYKDNIKEFMKTIQLSQYVIMIVSDGFLKSKYCMNEAIMLFDDNEFKQKIVPVIDSSSLLYDAASSIQYIVYWEEKKEKLQDQINKVKDNSRTQKAMQELSEIDEILRFLDQFIDYIENVYIKPIEVYIDEDFKTIFSNFQ